MLKRVRQLPENLRGVIELQKSETDGKLAKIARDAETFLIKQKNIPRDLQRYLETLTQVVEVFRSAPVDSYKKLEERDRKMFSKEIRELSEEPIHNFKHIVEVMKVVNEALEKMFFRTKFFGHEVEHHHEHAHHVEHHAHPHPGGAHAHAHPTHHK